MKHLLLAIWLGGGMIVLAACAPAATPTPADTIQGIVWQWTSLTNKTTKETTTIPTSENYTITFNADDTLFGKAECNNVTGPTSQENGFTIELGAMAMAFYGEGSLD